MKVVAPSIPPRNYKKKGFCFECRKSKTSSLAKKREEMKNKPPPPSDDEFSEDEKFTFQQGRIKQLKNLLVVMIL